MQHIAYAIQQSEFLVNYIVNYKLHTEHTNLSACEDNTGTALEFGHLGKCYMTIKETEETLEHLHFGILEGVLDKNAVAQTISCLTLVIICV